MVHHLKIRLTFADAVLRGDKTFEIRKNDRGFQRYDQVIFEVVDDFGNRVQHDLNNKRFHINYVLNGWGLGADYCVFSIKPAESEAPTPEVEATEPIPIDWIYDYQSKNPLSQTQFDAIDRMTSVWIAEQEAKHGTD